MKKKFGKLTTAAAVAGAGAAVVLAKKASSGKKAAEKSGPETCAPALRCSARLSVQKVFSFLGTRRMTRRRRGLHIPRPRRRRELTHSVAPALPVRPAALGPPGGPGKLRPGTLSKTIPGSVQKVF